MCRHHFDAGDARPEFAGSGDLQSDLGRGPEQHRGVSEGRVLPALRRFRLADADPGVAAVEQGSLAHRGNTEFCNDFAAYDSLPDADKNMLDGMTAAHALAS